MKGDFFPFIKINWRVIPNCHTICLRIINPNDIDIRKRSRAPSSSKGGDLGYLKPGTKSRQFDAAAFSGSLEVGRISNIFKEPDGYYILKLEAKQWGKERTLSEMWDDIKRGLAFLKQQQAIDDLIGEISRESKIEIYEGVIE